MTRLLVSVRSAAEAETALAGGAEVIDIKEPSRGSLGRADDAVIRTVLHAVAGRRPISAALGELGELLDEPFPPPPEFAGLVKVGLAGCASKANWVQRLKLLVACFRGPPRNCPDTRSLKGRESMAPTPGHALVAVAYADWERAGAPAPHFVIEAAADLCCPGLLIDTWQKDGASLLDWLGIEQLRLLRKATERHGLFLALAGSLRAEHIAELLPLGPDLLAFRSAACRSGNRAARLDERAVRQLAAAIHGASRKLTKRTSFKRAAALGSHASTNPNLAQSPGVDR